MKKTIKKQKKKLQIFSLAEDVNDKMIKNRIIYTQINNYNKYIELIKSFISKCSRSNKITENLSLNKNKSKNDNDINNIIKQEFEFLLKNLKSNIDLLKGEINKLKQKYDSNNITYFDIDLSSYKRAQEDSFILSHSLDQKLNIIKRLKQSIHSSKDYNIFQEPKRETFIDIKIGEENIDYNNEEIQKYALYEIKQFNKYYNRSQRKLKKKNIYNNKIRILNQIINYFKEINNYRSNANNYKKTNSAGLIFRNGNQLINTNSNGSIIKNKNYLVPKKNYKEEDINYNSSLTQSEVNPSSKNTQPSSAYVSNQTFNYINFPNELFPIAFNKEHRNSLKKKKKIIIPKFEELFDLANNEGEKEALIDEELHSDDEIVFLPKIKQNKKIVNDYISEVKEKIPKISLSLIEYNKIKIINEADLYSYNRRKEQRGNADENIKIMKNKLKIIKRRCNINKKKYETMKNFLKECENDYNRLKTMKVQMSVKADVHFMKKEFYIQNEKDKIDEEDELNYQKELDEYLNDPELNEPYFKQYQDTQIDITQRHIEAESSILKKINNENIENNADIEKKKYYNKNKTHREYKKEKIKRANSK